MWLNTDEIKQEIQKQYPDCLVTFENPYFKDGKHIIKMSVEDNSQPKYEIGFEYRHDMNSLDNYAKGKVVDVVSEKDYDGEWNYVVKVFKMRSKLEIVKQSFIDRMIESEIIKKRNKKFFEKIKSEDE